MKNLLIVIVLLTLSYNSYADYTLSDDFAKYIQKRERYNRKSLRIAYKKGLNKDNELYQKALLIPTFINQEDSCIESFLGSLKIDDKNFYNLIIDKRAIRKYEDGSMKNLVYNDSVWNCEVHSIEDIGVLCRDSVYLTIDHAYTELYHRIPPDMRIYCHNVYLFLVIGYEDYWFLLKEDKLWAYSLSKQILYTTEEQVTRIIQHKEVE